MLPAMLVVLLAAAGLRSASAAEKTELLVVQPGSPGSTAAAKPFMERLAKFLGKQAKLAGLEATYFNATRDALAATRVKEKPARVAVVSLGFYLAHKKEFGLTPLLEFLPEGNYHLIAPAKSDVKAGTLNGQAVVGGVLDERDFVARILFAEVEGVGAWKAVSSNRVSRALRKLERGSYQAAIIDSREKLTLDKLGKLKDFKVLASSKMYPAALLVCFGDGAREEGAAIARVFSTMQSDKEGKSLLKDMSCAGTREVRAQWLEKLEKRYHEPTK